MEKLEPVFLRVRDRLGTHSATKTRARIEIRAVRAELPWVGFLFSDPISDQNGPKTDENQGN